MIKKLSILDRGIAAWVAYDFINSLIIINGSLFFSAWITQDQGVNSFWYGFAFTTSTVMLLMLLPLKGAFLDRNHWGRETLFVLSIALGIAALCLPGIALEKDPLLRVSLALIMFAVINFVYQASLVSYNWILTHLRAVGDDMVQVRRVSGLGEAWGSFGSVVGAALGAYLLTISNTAPYRDILQLGGQSGRVGMFLPLSILFLFLVLINFWALGRGCKPPARSADVGDTRKPYRQLIKESFDFIWGVPKLKGFFWAFIFYADGLLTVQLYLPIYMRERLAMSDQDAASMFVVALCGAVAGALAYSRFGQQDNSKRALVASLSFWVITLMGFGFVEGAWPFRILMIWCGFLYGVVWSSSRAYLIELVPGSLIGSAFSYYAVFDRSASILGPLTWGAIMLIPMKEIVTKYAVAFGVMGLMVLIGTLLLIRTNKME